MPRGAYPCLDDSLREATSLLLVAEADKDKVQNLDYPWAKILEPDYLPPLRILDSTDARTVCESIARRYQNARERDYASLPLAIVEVRFANIERKLGEVVRLMRAMTADEYRIVIGHSLLEADGTPSPLALLRAKVGTDQLRPTNWVLKDAEGLSCPVADNLDTVSRLFGALRGHVHGKDRGGDVNIALLMSAAPIWILVHHSWSLFQALGLRAKTTEGGRLDRFLGKLHEWVTGEPDQNFSTKIKEYRRVRLRCFAVVRKLRAKLNPMGFRTPEEIQTWLDRYESGRPPLRRQSKQPGLDDLVREVLDARIELANGLNAKLFH